MESNILAAGIIIGIVNGVKLFQTNKESFAYFALALALGIAFGMMGLFGLTLETGIAVALGSSGLYKVATRVGGQ